VDLKQTWEDLEDLYLSLSPLPKIECAQFFKAVYNYAITKNDTVLSDLVQNIILDNNTYGHLSKADFYELTQTRRKETVMALQQIATTVLPALRRKLPQISEWAYSGKCTTINSCTIGLEVLDE
jgi:hypothetical protein